MSTPDIRNASGDAFADPAAVAHYAQGPVRLVPGFRDMQRMARLLLAERMPDDGRLLVLGAGGGLELKAFGEEQPGWCFVGVDPSAQMLSLAGATMGPAIAARTTLVPGYIDDAPPGPFDGATCLLTLHFIAHDERLRTLRAMHDRLRPGAPLVVAHHSVSADEFDRTRWLERFGAYAAAGGMTGVSENMAAMREKLPLLSPEQDAGLLAEAGFRDVTLFYAAFTFRGWVAYRA